ncbi:hypothetical protein CANARDRAFT_29517 [[Candida] arabinofermentans NRRL YB-2248]|uniref:Uncharacterized protein n=1 Tax=[Candida] arabinofermentans NRRL YB-2248 TaxID=983967 RepID=A0A1E4SX34_9ASCO|nr:hypothetical protein CANARDRAFT_29517 [[Candida] arabinofermentans NRRL YB-2248]
MPFLVNYKLSSPVLLRQLIFRSLVYLSASAVADTMGLETIASCEVEGILFQEVQSPKVLRS